jgi:hypothetical protein
MVKTGWQGTKKQSQFVFYPENAEFAEQNGNLCKCLLNKEIQYCYCFSAVPASSAVNEKTSLSLRQAQGRLWAESNGANFKQALPY